MARAHGAGTAGKPGPTGGPPACGQNGLLSLDKSEYLGVTDYEIEYEVTKTENAIEDFNAFLKTADVKYVQNCKGKRHRLCDVLYGTPQ